MPALPRAAFLGRSLALAIVLVFLVAARAAAQILPALPEVFLDTTYAPPTGGKLIVVGANADLQLALDQALPGDILQLQAGASFTGNFTLRNKSGAGWIYIQSSAYSSLPAPGTRVNPTHAGLMPRIVSPNTAPAITSEFGAHHYRFVGIEITTAWATRNFTHTNVILLGYDLLGNQATSVAQLPTDITFDRCYIHGTPTGNVRRGILMNGVRTAVIDSYLSDFHEDGADSQAFVATNGPGPFKIVNNYLEGAGENVMFGGADPAIPNLVPSDIEVRRNYFFKPLTWKIGHPEYAGIPWTVKNLFELKNARRILIEGNLFEHSWAHAQVGFAVLFTVRNQDGTAPWSTVEDVTFRNNIVRHSGSGINILGLDNSFPSSSQQTKRIAIRNNLFADIDGTQWGGDGRLFQLLVDTADVVIEHNTAFQTGVIIMADGAPNTGFVYRDNIAPHNEYGVFGSGFGVGLPALAQYFPNAVFEYNVLAGQPGYSTLYPPRNFFPTTLADVGFSDLAAGDYRLAPLSPYKNSGSDGTDIGADIDAVNAATAGVSTGASTPENPPPSDGTRPSVSVTAPVASATVSGTIVVSASASDNVGVAGVQFKLDGANLGAEATGAPYSVSWDTTAAANGTHTLTAVARDAAGNSATSGAVTVIVSNIAPPPPPPSLTPFLGTPFAVPGRIQAENFDNGGEGVAYHDLTPANQGGQYRTDVDVDIIAATGNAIGYVVNNFESGEWLSYSINVRRSGVYRIEARVSSEFTDSRWHAEIDGVNVTGPIAVPSTGWWGTFQWFGKDGVSLTAGRHVLRIVAEQQYFNLDAIRILQQP
jgi:hypothetical protein